MSTATLEIEKKKTFVPQLRFSGFDGEWDEVKLGKLAERIGDGLHGTPKYSDDSDINFINGNNLTNGKIEITEKTKKVDYAIFTKNDKGLNENTILISLNGTIGNIAKYNNEKVMLGKSVGYFNFKENRNFYFHVFHTDKIQNFFISELTGSTIKNLSLKTLRETVFPFPPLPEQQKIASFLSAVDEKIQQLSRKKELLEQYKKGVMQQLFSGKLRFKDENGEDYPDWEEKKLGEIANVSKLAGYEFTKHIVYEDKGEIIALRGLNIKKNKLDLNDVKYIDNSEFSKLSRSKLYIDDLMFTYVGTIGEVALINENDKYYLAPNVSRIRVNTQIITPNYILQYFNVSKFRNNEIEKFISSSSQPALSMENVRKFKIQVPSLQEQQKIADFLSSIDSKLESVSEQLAQTQNFKKGLLQQMFV
ncbi:restriction endonuclease subunit S [Flavobacterium yafengii]|uniref:restriction endonuclease subunit S n=1 Tax=Flavobacterium yafengii TaxID=3041253 RepID=UPI0024A912DD|nr:restriction endonuclease subunit S [Flavobacterium yafengii]MDI5899447.1 restriction endonuclease subunit S [Flavobacterium yafengii]